MSEVGKSPEVEMVERLRSEVEFVKGEAAAWGVDFYGDLPRTTALLAEAATLIESIARERDEARARASTRVTRVETEHHWSVVDGELEHTTTQHRIPPEQQISDDAGAATNELLRRLTAAEARLSSMREALEAFEAEARRYAEFYPEASDGRNTFVMLANWMNERTEALRTSAQPDETIAGAEDVAKG